MVAGETAPRAVQRKEFQIAVGLTEGPLSFPRNGGHARQSFRKQIMAFQSDFSGPRYGADASIHPGSAGCPRISIRHLRPDPVALPRLPKYRPRLPRSRLSLLRLANPRRADADRGPPGLACQVRSGRQGSGTENRIRDPERAVNEYLAYSLRNRPRPGSVPSPSRCFRRMTSRLPSKSISIPSSNGIRRSFRSLCARY